MSQDQIVTAMLPQGAAKSTFQMFRCHGRDQVAAQIGSEGWQSFEKPFPSYFYACASLWTGLILDVGANTGFYSLLAVCASADNRVVAFEPDTDIAISLHDNLALNQFSDKVQFSPLALSSKPGRATLYIPPKEHGLIETSSSLEISFKADHSELREVEVDTLDEFLSRSSLQRDPISIIKIDVEGHEMPVLIGAKQTVDAHRPILFVEVLHAADFAQLDAFLEEHSYVDVQLNDSGATVAESGVVYDPAGWNHAFVPREKLGAFLDLKVEALPEDVEGGRLENVALGKPASQSSLSQWSAEGEACNAVSGSLSQAFAFHTATEQSPWWCVDLLEPFAIERLVIHNRQEADFQDRASTLVVEISMDGARWTLVHKGVAFFGGGAVGRPLVLPLAGKLKAQFVRLSLTEWAALHLSQVEVFARTTKTMPAEVIAFQNFQQINRLSALQLGENGWTQDQYALEIDPASELKNSIIGVKVAYAGRFGNFLHQHTHAILFAERTGLKFVQFGPHELFDFSRPIAVSGVELVPSGSALPTGGVILSGVFFNSDPLVPVLSPFHRFAREDEADHSRVALTFLRPLLIPHLSSLDEKPQDELTIHIRSGDIFGTDEQVRFASWYRQPPLSFYQLVVDELVAAGTINKVLLVFEDRRNPCVDALESWLIEKKISVRAQSESLSGDISALLDAPHLVFGFGTFGYSVCRLSENIKTLHYFAPELGGRYAFIPSIARVFCVTDSEGGYFKAGEWGKVSGDGEWANTTEQREMMLTYPRAALTIEHVGGCMVGSAGLAPMSVEATPFKRSLSVLGRLRQKLLSLTAPRQGRSA